MTNAARTRTSPRSNSQHEVWRSLWQAGLALLAVVVGLGALLALATYYAAGFLVAGIGQLGR